MKAIADIINHPSHYTRGKTEVWTFIREQQLNYHRACALKYICRAGWKDDELDDLRKAVAYLNNEIDYITKERSCQTAQSINSNVET